MYQKLLIDSALEYRVTEDIKNIFLNIDILVKILYTNFIARLFENQT